ncbi:MAG TPA: hypothetical protein VE978_11245 [Chitinophagales bacterium]|nr:hypothetical protein [Chitinophagales bacterium]
MSIQFQITSRPRHLRYAFFVDENYPYEKLLALIHTNQRIWGGRFNPIVPVKDNVISEPWKNVLKFYDPDFVFHSKEIDSEIIRKLRFFNPCGYYNLDDQPKREDISGVDSFYFLSEFHIKSRLILTAETWKTESPLLPFYQINFGYETSLMNSEVELSKDFDRTIVRNDEFALLNKFIHELRPINQSHLSKKNVNPVILRSQNYNSYYKFEIVVAKDKSSVADLLYYWNRMLFEIRTVMYVTVEELKLLCEDEHFGKVLYDMDWCDAILVTSQSLSKEEIQEIVNSQLKKTTIYRRFESSHVENFPFTVMDSNGSFEKDFRETSIVQTLHSRNGLLHLPKLSFTNQIGFSSQRWAVDIQIKKLSDNYQNEFKLPFTTQTQYIVKGVKGRINRRRNISVVIHNHQNTHDTLEINIPEFSSLLRQLISHPVIHGETKKTKYIDIGPHDDSNKLSAFLKTFNFDFSAIDDFFTDIFWVTTFEELIRSERATKDSISFEDLVKKCKAELANAGIVKLGKSGKLFSEKGEAYKNEENLRCGLKQTMSELCDYKVFLRGFHLKCAKCSSQFWYHIKEVSEKVKCKGCLETFDLEIEPSFAYKLNDLIKNNMFKVQNRNDNLKLVRDGNLTVIRTLVSIHRQSHQSFEYNPQVNLYDDPHCNNQCTDIDVVCLSNGQFIIGEAKHDSTAFSAEENKALHSIAEIAKEIRPDKIILSCYEDNNGKLEEAKRDLIDIFNHWEYQPEIEILPLYTPDDTHLGHHRYFCY